MSTNDSKQWSSRVPSLCSLATSLAAVLPMFGVVSLLLFCPACTNEGQSKQSTAGRGSSSDETRRSNDKSYPFPENHNANDTVQKEQSDASVEDIIDLFRSVLDSTESLQRVMAIQALSKIQHKAVVPYLVKGLRDIDILVRIEAARGLGEHGVLAKEALTDLRRFSRGEKDNLFRKEIIDKAIRQIETPATVDFEAGELLGDKEIQQLLEDFGSYNQRDRERADEFFRTIGDDAIPYLINTLKDGDVSAIEYASLRISEIGAPAKSAVPYLIKNFEHPSPYVKGNSIHALGSMGLPAVPSLIDVFADGRDYTNQSAVHALIGVGRPAIPGLREALRSEDPNKRVFSAFALGELGGDARDALSDLKAALKEESVASSRSYIRTAIRKIETNYERGGGGP